MQEYTTVETDKVVRFASKFEFPQCEASNTLFNIISGSCCYPDLDAAARLALQMAGGCGVYDSIFYPTLGQP